jgi:hypothetical protein
MENIVLKRIFYECRDITAPSGGVRRLYRHVEILNKNGFSAAILHHSPGFRFGWFESQAPISYWTEQFALAENDVIVIPEGHVDVIVRTQFAAYNRVIIALNWANIYPNLPSGIDYRDLGVKDIIAGSECEHDFLLRSMNLESTIIVSGIDSELFKPAANGKRLQIAYMPRKNLVVFRSIAGVFRSKYPQFSNVPFVPVDRVDHSAVAGVLSESLLFLATGFPEGLARPPLEAMAAGCIVVGFAGRGALEYMRHEENCFLANDWDVLAAADGLARALQALDEGRAGELQKRARETGLRYSLKREEESVVAYWRGFNSESFRL